MLRAWCGVKSVGVRRHWQGSTLPPLLCELRRTSRDLVYSWLGQLLVHGYTFIVRPCSKTKNDKRSTANNFPRLDHSLNQLMLTNVKESQRDEKEKNRHEATNKVDVQPVVVTLTAQQHIT